MKSFTMISTLAVVLFAGAWVTPQRASAQGTSVSFQLFYDQLSPYGTWVDYNNYGYVWIPDVDQDFSPYGTDGHWVLTDDGWTWASDYSWGWAPFHYGRWAYDDSYGWLWVPQNEWGPAWVTWRRSAGYYGWAPMGPGISIDISFGRDYRVPNDHWRFVNDRDFDRSDIDRHYVDRSTNVTIINNSTVINNTYNDSRRNARYIAGPAKDDVQKVTGRAITPVVIRENDKPGQTLSNDQLRIYRPRVQSGDNNDRKPAPAKLVSLKEVKPINERKPGNQQRVENPPANGKEQSARPANVNPVENRSTGEQPRVVNPNDKNNRIEVMPHPQPATPPEKKGRGEQRLVVDPNEKSRNPQEPPKDNIARPPDEKGIRQQSKVVNPPYKNKSIEQPTQSQPVQQLDKKRIDRQPQIAHPPEKNNKMNQFAKPRKGLAPNPKDRVRDVKPPNPEKQRRDSSKVSQQQTESLQSPNNGNEYRFESTSNII